MYKKSTTVYCVLHVYDIHDKSVLNCVIVKHLKVKVYHVQKCTMYILYLSLLMYKDGIYVQRCRECTHWGLNCMTLNYVSNDFNIQSVMTIVLC